MERLDSPTSSDLEALSKTLANMLAFGAWRDDERAGLAAQLTAVHASKGELVVVQGQRDRSMYFCVRGSAAVVQNGVHLQRVREGEHFGELGLINGTPRAASVQADSDLLLGCLSHEGYLGLQAAEPALARRFVEAMLVGVSLRLSEMTESVQQLLHARSLPRRAQLDLQVMGRAMRVQTGTPVRNLLPAEVAGHSVVAALINQRPASLATVLSSNCSLEPLSSAHWEGQRVFRKSLGLLCLEAAHRLDAKLELHMEQSTGLAQRVRIEHQGAHGLAELALQIAEQMRQLSEANAPLREEWWTVDEAVEHFRERGWQELLDLLSTWRDATVPVVSYGEVHALRQGPLVPNANQLRGFDVQAEEAGLLLVYGDMHRTLPPPADDQRKSFLELQRAVDAEHARAVSQKSRELIGAQERWLNTLSIHSVGAFNRTCLDGNVEQFIRVNEGFHEKAIGQIADRLAARKDTVKIVCVAGPSSSGKTTFIKRLRVQLQVNGINPIGLSLDDYYVERERTPRDEHGEYDYEALEALDLRLLAEQLEALLGGAAIHTARYDFRTGHSAADGGSELQLGSRDMLML
jgi:uridine kinase